MDKSWIEETKDGLKEARAAVDHERQKGIPATAVYGDQVGGAPELQGGHKAYKPIA